MKKGQNNALESLYHVQAFLDANATALPGVAKIGLRVKLDEAVAALAAYVVGQGGGGLVAKGSTQRHRSLRAALLRDHMAPLAGVAVVELPAIPEVTPLRMPKARISAANLAAAANSMADAATPYGDAFVAAGLPADFIAQLIGASHAMMESTRQRSHTLGRRSSATKGVSATLVSVRKVVRALDKFVKSSLWNQPALLVGWKAAKHIRRTVTTTVTPPVGVVHPPVVHPPVVPPVTPVPTPVIHPPVVPVVPAAAA